MAPPPSQLPPYPAQSPDQAVRDLGRRGLRLVHDMRRAEVSSAVDRVERQLSPCEFPGPDPARPQDRRTLPQVIMQCFDVVVR